LLLQLLGVANLAAEKSVDANDIAHSFVLSYVYEIPVGKGRKVGSGMTLVAAFSVATCSRQRMA
jgi:hypothetical protein